MKKFILLIILSIFIMPSCIKHEGFGGKAKIVGKIKIEEYNYDFSILKESYYAQNEDVFIVFGDETKIGDKTDTHYDGTFSFEYLQKGKYSIYVYSDDKNGNSISGKIPIIYDVTINKRNEIVDIGELVIAKTTDENSGSSSVSGKVYVQDYNIDFTFIEEEYYAMDQDVYLIYGDEEFYMDDVETNYNGVYTFKNLPTGTYKVFAYSKDPTFTIPGGEYPVFIPFEISQANQHISLEDLIIIK